MAIPKLRRTLRVKKASEIASTGGTMLYQGGGCEPCSPCGAKTAAKAHRTTKMITAPAFLVRALVFNELLFSVSVVDIRNPPRFLHILLREQFERFDPLLRLEHIIREYKDNRHKSRTKAHKNERLGNNDAKTVRRTPAGGASRSEDGHFSDEITGKC